MKGGKFKRHVDNEIPSKEEWGYVISDILYKANHPMEYNEIYNELTRRYNPILFVLIMTTFKKNAERLREQGLAECSDDEKWQIAPGQRRTVAKLLKEF